MENKKYFAVTTKCGHVGRNYYLPVTFGVVANSKKEAAKLGKDIPRVKHAHKYAILEVREINYNEYKMVLEENDKNLFLKCKNKQDQLLWCPNLHEMILEDDHNLEKNSSKTDRRLRIQYKQKKLKEYLMSYYMNTKYKGRAKLIN